MRVLTYRALKEGTAVLPTQVAGSNDDGFKIVGTGATNAATCSAGYLFGEGVPVKNAAPFSVPFTAPHGSLDRIDVVYLSLNEQEVADPAQVAQLGETTKRLKLVPTVAVVDGTANASPVAPAIPANSSTNLWEGGTRYYKLAEVLRTATVTAIASTKVTDFRQKLPPAVLAGITHQWPQTAPDVPLVTGNWTLTAGDGVTTFGDFNGSTALASLVAFLNSQSAEWSAVIHLKGGTYAAVNVSVPVACSLKIVGDPRTRFTPFGNVGTVIEGSGALFSLYGALEIEDVVFTNTTGTSYAYNMLGTSVYSRFCARRCVWNGFTHRILWQGTGVLLHRQPLVTYEDCTLLAGNAAEPLIVTHSDSLIDKAVFNRCNLVGMTGMPIFEVEHAQVNSLLFKDCDITTGGITGVLSTANNGGAFNVKFYGSSDPNTIGDVVFDNCRVRAPVPSGGSAILMYLACGKATSNTDTINSVTIRGGSWLSDADASSTYAPFYIGPILMSSASAPVNTTFKINNVCVDNVELGWTTTDALQIVGSTADEISLPVAVKNTAHAFLVKKLKLRDVRIKNAVTLGSGSDVYICCADSVDVNGLDIDVAANVGAGSLATNRLVVSELITATGVTIPAIQRFNGVSIQAHGFLCASEFINVAPKPTGSLAGSVPQNVIFDKTVITEGNWAANGSGGNGILIMPTINPSITRITIRDPMICLISGNGVVFADVSNQWPVLKILGGEIAYCQLNGVYGKFGSASNFVEISDVTIHHCGAEGVALNATVWNTETWSLQGNHIHTNNGAATAVQCVFGSASSAGNLNGHFINNNLGVPGNVSNLGIARFLVGAGLGYSIKGSMTSVDSITRLQEHATVLSLTNAAANDTPMVFNTAYWRKS